MKIQNNMASIPIGKDIDFIIYRAWINPECGRQKIRKIQLKFRPCEEGFRDECWSFEPGHESVGLLMLELTGSMTFNPTPRQLKKLEGMEIIADVKFGHGPFKNLINIRVKNSVLNTSFPVNDSKSDANPKNKKQIIIKSKPAPIKNVKENGGQDAGQTLSDLP